MSYIISYQNILIWILFWDVCPYETAICVVNLSETLAASVFAEQRETAQVTQAGRLLYLWDGQKG
jgi:hypothetical protein